MSRKQATCNHCIGARVLCFGGSNGHHVLMFDCGNTPLTNVKADVKADPFHFASFWLQKKKLLRNYCLYQQMFNLQESVLKDIFDCCHSCV